MPQPFRRATAAPREKESEQLPDRNLLATALQVAIPLHAQQLDGASPNTLERIARFAGESLACYGDVLQFKTAIKSRPKKCNPYGDPPPMATTDIFNTLARGLAAASLLGADVDMILDLIRGEKIRKSNDGHSSDPD